MFKVQIYNNIAKDGLNKFDPDYYTLGNGNEISSPDCILLRSHKLKLDEINNSVLAIARAGSGVNNVPVEDLTKRGIPVFNTPGANSNAVKELVLAGLFLSARNICSAWQYVSNIKADNYLITDADQLNNYVEQGKKQFKGIELPGKTLAVIGLGAIGVKVANAAKSLGMNVVGYDPGITVESAWQLSSDVLKAKTIKGAIKKADFVTIHVPLVKDTIKLVNNDILAQLKPTCVLLNFARNEIVDEQSVNVYLNNNNLACYVTDFPSGLLATNEKVIALPHIGASTIEAEENCAMQAVDTLKNFLQTGFICNSVNFPEVIFTDDYEYRLAVINENVPNMVAQITSILAEDKFNIVDLINKSRENIAYTLIDLDKSPSDTIINRINHIEGVLSVRKIDFKDN